ncbi:MAG: zinc ribbon domain-containing protein [Armatimonadetes bacterium]|nr:zinc ribbon domain-containing protein [Armatimonadota bacterium]
MSFSLSHVLTQGQECPTCGEENDAHARHCDACGLSFDAHEEAQQISIAPSVTAAQPELELGPLTEEQQKIVDQMRTKIPLEKGENYILFRQAFDGAQKGEISKDNYRQVVRKLRNIGENGRKVLEHDVVSKKIAAVSEEARDVQAQMLSGFRQIQEGATRMEAWLVSHDTDDLIFGAEMVDAGYHNIDEAQDRALAMH